MSDEELEAVEKRCELATAGPWESWIEGRDHESGMSFIRTAGEDIYLTGASDADQDFVAGARQDIPALIVEIRRLKAVVSR